MTIFSSGFSAQLCYKVPDRGPHAACPQNTESLFYSAELFYSRGTFLPWDRRRRAPPRCHSHHPHPPDEALGAALPQTRVRARYCCWDRDLYRISLTRSRKPLNWQAQTQHNTTCCVPRQSNAIFLIWAATERLLRGTCLAAALHRVPPPFFSAIGNTQFWQLRNGAGEAHTFPNELFPSQSEWPVFAEGAGATAAPHAQPRLAPKPGARVTESLTLLLSLL